MRLQWRAVGLAVAVLALAVFFSRGYVWSYDGYVMRQVAESMVTHHSLRVADDPLGLSTPYASYGIGMSLFMAFSEVVAPMLGATPSQLDALINPVVLAAIAMVVW